MRHINTIINGGNSSRLNQKLKELMSLGNRFAGSKADNLAAEFMQKKFYDLNMEVIKEEFTGHLFEEYESYIMIGNARFECRAMYYSESTKHEMKAEAVILGFSEEVDYNKIDVKEKIVIVFRSHHKDDFWNEVNKASLNGAIGFILINYHPWVTVTTLETGYFDCNKRLIPMESSSIPALVIGSDDGEKIINLIKSGNKSIKIFSNVFSGNREAINIRGIKKGKQIPQERILVYGHRDTVGVQGANDNGSGTVIMLEVAELIKDMELKRSVEFISFSAEEHLGSLGSIAYLEQHKDELNKFHSSIEIDMVGSGKIHVMSGGAWKEKDILFSEELTDYVASVANKLGYTFIKDFSKVGTPDSGRFAEYGVPTTWIWCPDDIYYHSPEDTLDKVDMNNLKIISDVVATAVCNLANE